MVKAFLAGKHVGKLGYETSPGVWYGYGKALNFSVIVFVGEMLVLSFWALLANGLNGFGGGMIATLIGSLLYSIFTTVMGLIFYTAPAFFGFGIGKQVYVSLLIEKEANRTREEIEREMKLRQEARPHLD